MVSILSLEGIAIRKAVESDVPRLWEIYQTFEEVQVESLPADFRNIRDKKEGYEEKAKAAIVNDINEENAVFLVAECDGRVVGYVHGSLYKHEHPFLDIPMEGHLDDLAVDPDYRGRRIASMLRDELYGWFREKGVEQVFLRAISGNPALDIYRKWGFVTTAYNMRCKLPRKS